MPELFIQWKGTLACADFYCQCKKGRGPLHVHAEFMYYVECPYCGRKYKVPDMLQLEQVHDTGGARTIVPNLQEFDNGA